MKNLIMTKTTAELKIILQELVDLVIFMNEKSKKAISKTDSKLAMDIFELKNKFDQKFIILESEVLFALTKKPLAINLRRIIGYLLIAKDLESIAGYSQKISKFILVKKEKVATSSKVRVRNIHKPFRGMLELLTELIETESPKLSMSIVNMDDDIDALVFKTREAIVKSVMTKTNKLEIAERVFILNIVNSLERAADHIVSIAKNIIYIKTNKHIKL